MTFVIQDDPGKLFAGEVVTVVNKEGERKQLMVEHVYAYTTKAGKQLERAIVKDV